MTDTIKKHQFQAEVQQVLNIVIHSLYKDKEIFLRELISNASDALDKLRYLQLKEKTVLKKDNNLEIKISTDEKNQIIIIQDFGIGMNNNELIENLGMIANSGSRKFIESLSKVSKDKKESLIGQFGVGFYSVFMVAEKVDVYTRSYNDEESKGFHWSSDGSNNYTIENCAVSNNGCKIIIKLKEEYKDFSSESKIKSIIEKHSSFVNFPIILNDNKINLVKAIWLRGKSEIKEEEYKEFYKFQSNSFDDPISWLHFNADVPLDIKAILFIPKENVEKLGFGLTKNLVSLYCKKILIESSPKGLLPEWMRFLKGVVDSADIPLSISRESMQDTALIQKINKVLTKRFIKHLEELSKNKPDVYLNFWNTFNNFIKEGITTDYNNKKELIPLLRYQSSQFADEQLISLPEYVNRMQKDQKEIYYAIGKNRKSIESGPYVEAFTSRKLEILYLFETVDDFVISHIQEFENKKLISIDQDSINFTDDLDTKKSDTKNEEKFIDLCVWIKTILGENRVLEVKLGNRLTESPLIALSSENTMNPNMRRMMKAMKQSIDESIPSINLHINKDHALIKNIVNLRLKNENLAKKIVFQMYDSAMISAGILEDTSLMIKRNYSLLEELISLKEKI